MAYQNINQYNFKRFGLKPVNEVTDLCLASDEKDYDQEVIFSPLLIGESDGNRMPFKFNFNSSATTLCQTSSCVFSSDTIVSENYWNPTDTDPNFCPIVTNLCDVGLTGIDNGLVRNMSGETIQTTTGLYTNITDKFSRYKYDRRMKLHPITGFTTTQNRLWNDDSYTYDLSYTNAGGDIGYVATLNGGFFQGFYKLAGYDYQVFPERVNLGWTSEFVLRYRWTGNTDVGLNQRYPDNKGTFFYMGARAENKFYHYADGSPKQDSGYTRVTSGLTCMHTCGCASSANTSSQCLQVYQPSGGTITTCLCGCPCECNTTAQYPEKDPLYDGVSNALSLRLSGDTGSPRLCVKTYRITGGCESTGTCLTGLTYTTGTSVTEWCSTRGIFDDCSGTTYPNVEHWVQIDAVFERYEWLDTCDLYDKGGTGLLVKDVYFATLEGRSVTLIEPPITREQPYDPASTEVVTFNDMWTEEQKYRLGTLKFYVNGKLFLVTENFEEIIPRLLNVEKEKQIGVGYNISIGGGTQGLHDNLTFSGGCPVSLNDLKYQQDPECLTTHDLDNTIYSGLTTQIKLEEYFGGSMIGDISAFRMYTEPLNAAQIKHNFRILKDKYNLLNPDCLNCRIPIPANDLYYEIINVTPTPTPTPVAPRGPFVSVWNISTNIELPYSPTGTYSGTINWGDGNFSANTYSNRTHTYASSGTYTITITGTIEGWNFNNYATAYRSRILEIISWGTLRSENNSNQDMFRQCSNLKLTGVTDTPDLVGITSLGYMFRSCSSLTTVNNMNSWDVSSVTDMSNMFDLASSFNQNIGSWDVSSVTNMSSMFWGTSFNQNIGSWNVSSVTNMELMFYNVISFNQNIGSWNVSSVTNMGSMFDGTSSFNQNIGSWNVSSVTNMNSMFSRASSFNQDLSNWCVTLIPSTPSDFSLNATSWLLPKPVWGTCPPPPTPTPTITKTPTQTPTPTPTPTRP